MEIQIDMYQTLALSVVVLMLGQFLKQKINFLEKFCIPSPVVGGLIFSVLTCILYSTGVVEFTFDDTLREVCMVFFFTSVGFQANLKVLKSGGEGTCNLPWISHCPDFYAEFTGSRRVASDRA